MNGPQHYREAERIAAILLAGKDELHQLTAADVARYAAAGELHATLALAAATALGATQHRHGEDFFVAMRWSESKAWQDAAGVDS